MNKMLKKSIVGIMAATMICSSMAPYSVSAAVISEDAPGVSTSVSDSRYKISKTSIVVTKGYQYPLTVSNLSNDKINWTSANTTVATVSSDGKVVGKSVGTTYVYATLPNGDILSCNVTIVPTKITANVGSSLTLKENSQQKITLTIKGDKQVAYETSNSDIATASWGSWDGDKISFTIKAHNDGVATIKIYNRNDKLVYKTFTINVSNGQISIRPAVTILDVAENTLGTLPITFENTSGVGYYSDNPNVATMSNTYFTTDTFTYAELKTGRPGTAHIRVYALDNPDVYVTITINVKSTVPVAPYVQYYTEKTYNLSRPALNDVVFRNKNDQLAYWIEDGELKYMIVPSTYRPDRWEDIYCIPASEYSSLENDFYNNYYNIFEYNLVNPLANNFYVTAKENLIFWIDAKTHRVNFMIVPATKTTKYLAKYENAYALDHTGNPIYTNYNYYKVTTTAPDYLREGDQVHSFSYNLVTYYILTPEKADSAIVESLISNITKNFDYNTVYATLPTKKLETDMIITFNYKGEIRYILAADGTENSVIDKVKNSYYKSISNPLSFEDYNK